MTTGHSTGNNAQKIPLFKLNNFHNYDTPLRSVHKAGQWKEWPMVIFQKMILDDHNFLPILTDQDEHGIDGTRTIMIDKYN